jgi:hypothetical protein
VGTDATVEGAAEEAVGAFTARVPATIEGGALAEAETSSIA